jgi:hypothetical protein
MLHLLAAFFIVANRRREADSEHGGRPRPLILKAEEARGKTQTE